MSSGHLAPTGRSRISVTSDGLDIGAHLEFVADPSAGCSVVFTGMVRDHSPGRPDVSHLEYEAYSGVAESRIAEVVDEAFARWEIVKVAASHRTGRLSVGEPAVVVAVSAGHRDQAFPAARFVIDEVKSRAPIWKKEHWSGGAEWVREDGGR